MPLGYITRDGARQRLLELFQKHNDTGFRPHFQEVIFEPANPFQPGTRRKLKLPVLFFGSLAGAGLFGFTLFTIFR